MNFEKIRPGWQHEKAQMRHNAHYSMPQPGFQPNQLEAMQTPKVKHGRGFWGNMIDNYWRSLGI